MRERASERGEICTGREGILGGRCVGDLSGKVYVPRMACPEAFVRTPGIT